MTDEPTPEMINQWLRGFAVAYNKHTWILMDVLARILSQVKS